MSLTPLEQFNEEVMKEFEDKFPKLDYPLHIINCRCPLEPGDATNNIIQDKKEVIDLITQKLTEHKELILMEVKERSYARLKNVDALDWDRFEDILDEIKY